MGETRLGSIVEVQERMRALLRRVQAAAPVAHGSSAGHMDKPIPPNMRPKLARAKNGSKSCTSPSELQELQRLEQEAEKATVRPPW